MATGLGRMGSWQKLNALALVVLVIVVALELLAHPSPGQAAMLGLVEIACIAVIAVDLAVKFWKARSKMRFVRENWFEIAILLPFGAIFESLKAIEAFRAVEGLELLRVVKVARGAGHLGGLAGLIPLFRSKQEYIEITEDMMQG